MATTSRSSAARVLSASWRHLALSIRLAGSGLDWFWETYRKDTINRKSGDLPHERPGAEQGAACLSCRESRGPLSASLLPDGNGLLRFEVRSSTLRARPQEPCRTSGSLASGGEGLGGCDTMIFSG